ncbi:protein GET1 [Cornus florida]|uniref:protein GET1 n=1 Tax=Cornus florida TaxID=4283 RepID=UPI00289E7AC3|nr:protein GET1 [Cornus florida]
MEETLYEHRNSLAAPFIFFIVTVFQFLSGHIEHKKKSGAVTDEEIRLRTEIKQHYKEASLFTQPSTFAQAAKLRRMAAAKEREITKIQELHSKEIISSYDSYLKVLMISKVILYFILICWFWHAPVAAISEQLVQPFGKMLSWRAGGSLKNNVMVGIIPWLIVSTRVSKFICRKFIN